MAIIDSMDRLKVDRHGVEWPIAMERIT